MNPLYLVIYVAGAIGGTIGLLDPLTVSECQRQADEMHAARPRHYEEK